MEMQMNNEQWKDIDGYEGVYQISSFGRVKRLTGKGRLTERILRQYLIKYYYVKLSKDGTIKNYSVHRLLGAAFLPKLTGCTDINHKNGIKTDNRLENLEWCTRSENILHAINVLGRNYSHRNRLGKRKNKQQLVNA